MASFSGKVVNASGRKLEHMFFESGCTVEMRVGNLPLRKLLLVGLQYRNTYLEPYATVEIIVTREYQNRKEHNALHVSQG